MPWEGERWLQVALLAFCTLPRTMAQLQRAALRVRVVRTATEARVAPADRGQRQWAQVARPKPGDKRQPTCQLQPRIRKTVVAAEFPQRTSTVQLLWG